MTESLFTRVRRVVSSGVETVVSAAERASGSSLLREAIRDVEAGIERLRADRDAADARRIRTERAIAACKEDIAKLEDQTRYALANDRRDLAEAAVARQLDAEARLAALDMAHEQAEEEAKTLRAGIADLVAHRANMEADFDAFVAVREAEAAAHVAAAGGIGAAGGVDDTVLARVTRKVTAVRESFDRLVATADAPARPADAVGEIDALRRQETIAARLAALDGQAPAGKPDTPAEKPAARKRRKD